MAPRTSLTLLLSPAFLLLLSGHCSTVISVSFFYNFSDPESFIHAGDLHFEGHAYMGDGSIILAKNRDVRGVSSKAGWVSSNNPVYLWSDKTSEVVTGFSTSFSFVIVGGSNSSNDTGGTLSFFLTPFSPQMPLEKEAGLLGVFDSATAAGGSQLGVTAVMDRSSHGDFGWDTNMPSEKYKVVVHNLADGVPKILHLDYSDVAKDLVIALRDFTNGSTTATIKMSVDLRRHLPQEVAIGFFASTAGSGATVRQVLWWSFCTHTATMQGNLPNPTLARRYLLESPDNSSAPPPEGHAGSRGKSHRKVVLGAVVGVVLFLVTALVVACLCCIKKMMLARRMALAMPGLAMGAPEMVMGVPEMEDIDLGSPLAGGGHEGKTYSYEEVLNATDNFSEERLLGGGRSYSFYRGDNFENSGMTVAVKIMLEMKPVELLWIYECWARIRRLTQCRHMNMVRLMGWCRQGDTICIVYEYVENGNLVEHLYSRGRFLPWKLRYKIVLGMASALEYLHDNNVYHGNIKLSSVMLDESFDAKLGSFDDFKFLGTHMKANLKNDVRRFGIVLLNIACGHDLGSDKFVQGYLWDMYAKGTILEAADERLNGDFDNGEMERVLLVGLMCWYHMHPPLIEQPSIREAARLLRSDPSEPFLLQWKVPEPITDVDEACGSADHTLPKPSSP